MRSRVTPRRALGRPTLVNMAGSGACVVSLVIFLIRTGDTSAAAAAVCILRAPGERAFAPLETWRLLAEPAVPPAASALRPVPPPLS